MRVFFVLLVFFVLVDDVVLSRNVIINLSGFIFIGEIFLRLIAFFFMFCRVDWSDESSSRRAVETGYLVRVLNLIQGSKWCLLLHRLLQSSLLI